MGSRTEELRLLPGSILSRIIHAWLPDGVHTISGHIRRKPVLSELWLIVKVSARHGGFSDILVMAKQRLFDNCEVEMSELLDGEVEQVALGFNQLVALEHFLVELHPTWVVGETRHLECLHDLRQLVICSPLSITHQTILIECKRLSPTSSRSRHRCFSIGLRTHWICRV